MERAEFQSDRISKEDAQTRVDHLLRGLDTKDGRIARHILVTGSDEYKSAFGKALAGDWMTAEESNAMSMARAM